MSLDFTNVKKITIPDGDVTVDVININDGDGNELWCRQDVPTGYQILESLTSPVSELGSNDYMISTGIALNSDTDAVYIKFKMNNISGASDRGIFGARTNTSSKSFTLSINPDGKYAVGYNGSTTAINTPTPDTTTTHEYYAVNGKAYFDGVLVNESTPVSFTTPTVCNLFGVNASGGSHYYPGSVTIYSFRIIRDGKTIFNAVPVLFDEDGTVGMYNTIAQSYHSGWVSE